MRHAVNDAKNLVNDDYEHNIRMSLHSTSMSVHMTIIRFHSTTIRLHSTTMSLLNTATSFCLNASYGVAYFFLPGLPATKLGTYLETRVNSLLKRKDAGAGEVTIRVLSSYDKAVDVKPGMRSRFLNSNMPETFPYRVKAMFAFEEIDGIDVCFFGMHVQEYGSDCRPPNAKYYLLFISIIICCDCWY